MPILFLFLTLIWLPSVLMREILYDSLVSNHGARIRLLANFKSLDLNIKSPDEIGGVKSVEYNKLSIQGKSPVLIADDGFVVIESDSIARYLIDKYSMITPKFLPFQLNQRSLSDQICRIHDIYISPIQGCMYKAPGSIYGSFGSNRLAALAELKRQLLGIENMLSSIDSITSSGSNREFLCGEEISLADITLYPTITFCNYMLPQYFKWNQEDYLGPRLQSWYYKFSDFTQVKKVQNEILSALDEWKSRSRWNPIIKELQDAHI